MEGENRAFWEFCRADLKIPGPEKLSFDVFPKSCVCVSALYRKSISRYQLQAAINRPAPQPARPADLNRQFGGWERI